MFVSRRQTAIDQQNVAGIWHDQNIGRPDIAMNDLSASKTGQHIGQLEADPQANARIQSRLTIQNGFQGHAREVFQHQREAVALIDQRERFGNASDIQHLKEPVFALHASGLGCVGVFRKALQQHRRPIGQAVGTVEVGARCHADPFKCLVVRDDHTPPLSRWPPGLTPGCCISNVE